MTSQKLSIAEPRSWNLHRFLGIKCHLLAGDVPPMTAHEAGRFEVLLADSADACQSLARRSTELEVLKCSGIPIPLRSCVLRAKLLLSRSHGIRLSILFQGRGGC